MNARSMGKNHASKATAGEAARGGSREVVAQRPPRYVTLNRVIPAAARGEPSRTKARKRKSERVGSLISLTLKLRLAAYVM